MEPYGGIRDAQPRSRAWYRSSIAEFLETSAEIVIGRLAQNNQFALLPTQKDAWLAQIEILRRQLEGLAGTLLFEFNIPRMGRRIDAVLLIDAIVFVLEFKVGESAFERSAVDQVWDYALDLKNFHEASHAAVIVPILIPTASTARATPTLDRDADGVVRPLLVGPDHLRSVIDAALHISGTRVDEKTWPLASYRPTPTIIEAARALYAQHSVEAIARFDAGAQNLYVTSRRIEELVDEAMLLKRKLVCFVTGVPGAGKTLVGLNVATLRRDIDQPTHAVFLSGNGPLVAVLREALARDEVQRKKISGIRVRKGAVLESIKAFIQNVHHFRDEALVDSGPPVEHVAIFDEAQRAWNLQQTANFMRRKKNHPNFSQSEPEFLVSYMDRHTDWAVVVCLVGGGQEINTGESGIGAWLDAIVSKFPDWHMYISSKLTDSEYAAEQSLESLRSRANAHFDNTLHLAVSMRSFRAETVSAFVKALLDCDVRTATKVRKEFAGRYPICVTRDLSKAKQWIRDRARGSERYGLIASSKAQRLKPLAVDVRVDVDPVQWFLNGREDTRSSFYLEDAATEFQVQGLELDWACVTWDGDMRFSENGWSFHNFRGDRWCNVKDPDNRRYLQNAYRVLLTRARQGMVIFVPSGDNNDPTRAPAYYDATFDYLHSLGIEALL